jgi:hypothetical protein
MQLCLAHCALEPEKKTIIVLGGIVDPIKISYERTEESAGFQKLMPIFAGAGQPGHLYAENNAYVAQRYFSDEPLEARPSFRSGSRLAQIVIDYEHAFTMPTELGSSALQAVLEASGLLVLKNLLHSGLPHIYNGQTLPVG